MSYDDPLKIYCEERSEATKKRYETRYNVDGLRKKHNVELIRISINFI